ncbi:hypothetical protein DSECCO2_551100 [anaerobic digester metagenome]
MVGICHHLFLYRLDAFPECLDHGKIPVDDRVQQDVEEVIRPLAPEPSRPGTQALPDALKCIPRLLLERCDVPFPEHKADLFAPELTVAVGSEHPDCNVEILAVVLDLRALAGVCDVFQGQRVDPGSLPDCLDHPGLVDAVDVDPGNRRRAEGEGPEVPGPGAGPLVEMGFVVVDDRDGDRSRTSSAGVDEPLWSVVKPVHRRSGRFSGRRWLPKRGKFPGFTALPPPHLLLLPSLRRGRSG